MQFQPKVTLPDQNGWHLCVESRAGCSKDIYIAQAIVQGVGDREQMDALIAKAEGIDEIAALGLAQFVLDYNDFIA